MGFWKDYSNRKDWRKPKKHCTCGWCSDGRTYKRLTKKQHQKLMKEIKDIIYVLQKDKENHDKHSEDLHRWIKGWGNYDK